MDKIARIRQEIERLKKYYAECGYPGMGEYEQGNKDGRMETLDSLLSFTNTLSKEPDKSLEEAVRRYQECVTVDTTIYYCGASEDVYFANRIADAFKAGWKCRDDQMPMPEDTALFQKGVAEGRRLEREDMLKDAIPFYEILKAVPSLERENTRIIVVKDESK